MSISEPSRRPTYGSLFSGVGGMDLGFDDHFDCVFQVEWDKNCQSILRRHWPQVPKWSDVCDVNGAEIPPCDVLTFGSPCQDLSVAGKRAGLEGGRSSMFFEATRIIKEMRNATRSEPTGPFPRIAVWENVPGALSSNGGADFRAVLDEMVDCGAVECEWAVVDAQHFGVPQRRRRVFLVAIFDPSIAAKCPSPLLPVAKGRRRDYAKGRPTREGIAGGSQTSLGDIGDENHGVISPTLFATNQRSEVRELGDLAIALSASKGTNQTNYLVEPDAIPIQDGREMEKNQNGMGVGDEGDPSYTVDTTGAQSVAQPIVIDRAAFSAGANAQYTSTVAEADVIPSLVARGPHGVAQPLVYDGYNQSLDDSGVHRSLRVGRDSSDFIAQPIIFENSFRDGARINDDICHTLPAKMGTGGNNQPHVAQPVELVENPQVLAFDTQFGSNANVFTDMSPSLKASQQSPTVAEPVLCFQPGMMIRQSGGVWEETAPTLRAEAKRGDNEPHITQPVLAYEPDVVGPLTAGGLQAPRGTETSDSNHILAFFDEEPADATGDEEPIVFEPGAAGRLNGDRCSTEVAPTLRAHMGDNHPAVSQPVEPVMPALLAGMSHLTGTTQDGYVETIHRVFPTMAVRRLTPLECERLMGFPDNHTLIRDDGKEQADTHRYKQCGNGVATPVARWVAQQIVRLL